MRRAAAQPLLTATQLSVVAPSSQRRRSRREGCPALPEPTSEDLAFLVREPWPSVVTGAQLAHARYAPGSSLVVTSEMNDGGVVFGDGIEDDHLELAWGQTVTVRAAPQALRLVA